MNLEIVAVGTELLLGQIADTNGAWLGEQLALMGVDSFYHQVVGDNHDRIVQALRTALERSDGVIVCGGLGPTHDDLTREALAELMNVPLVRDPQMVTRIEEMFSKRGRTMSANNARQADVPRGATYINQTLGTAPGLICPMGDRVLYAVPGVPHEMADMFTRAIAPDLRARMESRGGHAVIVSRVLRVWGTSESALAELLAPLIASLERSGASDDTGSGSGVGSSGDAPGATFGAAATVAFLASGMEGIKVRVTVKAADLPGATALLDVQEEHVRSIVGNAVFGIDDETMESTVGRMLHDRGWTLGLAESLTGGLVASRIVDVPGASSWFRGSVVSYSSEVKHGFLDVPEGPVVGEVAARAMALGTRRVLGSDVGLSFTGVAGPGEQDGRPVGTVFVGLSLPDREPEVMELLLPGDRARVRQYATISGLDLLRRRLAGFK